MPRPIVMPLYTTPPDPPTTRSTASSIAAQRLARARSRSDATSKAEAATTSAGKFATIVSERQSETKVAEAVAGTDAGAVALASSATADDGHVMVTEAATVDGEASAVANDAVRTAQAPVVAALGMASKETVTASAAIEAEASAVADDAVRAAAEVAELEMAFEKATADVHQTEAAVSDGDDPTTWIEYGGAQLEPLLSFTTLLDVRWLLAFARCEVLPELGSVVPAWQALPAEAEVKLDDLQRSTWYSGLPVGALSYGWASDAQ